MGLKVNGVSTTFLIQALRAEEGSTARTRGKGHLDRFGGFNSTVAQLRPAYRVPERRVWIGSRAALEPLGCVMRSQRIYCAFPCKDTAECWYRWENAPQLYSCGKRSSIAVSSTGEETDMCDRVAGNRELVMPTLACILMPATTRYQ